MIAALLQVECQNSSSMTVDLSFDECSTGVNTSLMRMEIGMSCLGSLRIQMPANVSTAFHVEIYSPNGTQSLIFGKPYFDYDLVYNIDSEVNPFSEMTSSSNDLRVIIFLIFFHV